MDSLLFQEVDEKYRTDCNYGVTPTNTLAWFMSVRVTLVRVTRPPPPAARSADFGEAFARGVCRDGGAHAGLRGAAGRRGRTERRPGGVGGPRRRPAHGRHLHAGGPVTVALKNDAKRTLGVRGDGRVGGAVTRSTASKKTRSSHCPVSPNSFQSPATFGGLEVASRIIREVSHNEIDLAVFIRVHNVLRPPSVTP